MKKIGILTFHNVPNYGAALQVYALKNFLELISGTEASVIDFQCQGNANGFEPSEIERSIASSKSPFLKRAVKITLFKLFTKKEYSIKTKAFSDFRSKYLNIDSDLESLSENYELFVCGSDQIWNPNITDGLKDYYFGANKNQKGVRTVSYAASCGNVDDVCCSFEKPFFEMLSSLDKIGVREVSLDRYLKENNVESSCNIDPTFLLSKDDYVNGFSLKNTDKKYILCYALQKNPALKTAAEQISKRMGLPIIYVCGYIERKPHASNELFSVSPTGFLELLYNSEYVITNSFHGMAFSLIFEKNFNIVLPNSRASRLTDFLESLSLTNRICTAENINISDISYKEVNSLLNVNIEESKKYLINEVGALK